MKRQTIDIGLIICGGLTVLTGLLMLFHYESHMAIGLHEVASLATLFFCILHIKVNWHPLVAAFKTKRSLYAVLGFLAGSLILLLLTGDFNYKEQEIRLIVKQEFGVELPQKQK